jgi:hypothetical protein
VGDDPRFVLGGQVLEEKLVGELMGMPWESVGQLGYDNVIGRYWTTAADNMGTGVFYMTGSLDPETGRGTFEGSSSTCRVPAAGRSRSWGWSRSARDDSRADSAESSC